MRRFQLKSNKFSVVILIILLITLYAVSLSALTEEEINQIYYQLDLYRELIEYLDEVFQDFSYGYLEPGPALKKINVITHQYNRTAGSVPEEAERMHELTKQLLSRVEYYFIFYKSNYRENPEINRKILETRYELAREAEKLLNMYGY